MKVLYLLTFFCFIGCSGKIISIHATDEEKKEYDSHKIFGHYSLPKTELKIQIPVVESVLQEGILRDTVSCLGKYVFHKFGWQPEKTPDEKYKVGDKIIFTPLTLPDPNKRYGILYNKAKALSQSMNITISKDGLIQSGEFAQESRAFEITKKAIELGGTLIGAIGGLGSGIGQYTPPCTIADLGNKRAVELVRDVEQLLTARYTLISQPPVNMNNTDMIKFQIAEIDNQLKKIKATLVGEVKDRIFNVTIIIDPKTEPTKEIVILKINPAKGIISNGDDQWKSISTAQTDSTQKETLNLSFRKLVAATIINAPPKTQQNSSDNSSTEKTVTNAFLYYNVPEKYELTLSYQKKPLPSFTAKDQKEGADDYQVYFPQLGKVAFLPADDFKEASVTYYEDIGAIKSAKLAKGAQADAEKVESFYKSVDSLRTTINAIRDSKEVKNEEPTEEKVEEQVIRLIIENVTPAN